MTFLKETFKEALNKDQASKEPKSPIGGMGREGNFNQPSKKGLKIDL